ncbi:hypothetical protein [Streptomyces sp. NPDC006368]|uniref:hypothetical protein n=1 Tax=Streptomyces sp. NPDC006368 TaxID=3156760 RepID=UPI0033B6E402
MTMDAVRDEELFSLEDRLRAEVDVLAGAARRLEEQAARLEERPDVPDWCVPSLRRQAESCRTAAEDLRGAASVLGRHTDRAAGAAGTRLTAD